TATSVQTTRKAISQRRRRRLLGMRYPVPDGAARATSGSGGTSGVPDGVLPSFTRPWPLTRTASPCPDLPTTWSMRTQINSLEMATSTGPPPRVASRDTDAAGGARGHGDGRHLLRPAGAGAHA